MFAQNKFEETNNLIEEDSGENQSLFNDIIIDLLKRKITKENSLKNQIELNKRQLLEKFYSIQQNSNKKESEINNNENNKTNNFKEIIFNTLNNNNNNINKYEEMREMLKMKKKKRKKKIFNF